MPRSPLKLIIPVLALALAVWIFIAGRPKPETTQVPAFDWPQPQLDEGKTAASYIPMASTGGSARTVDVAAGHLRIEDTGGDGLDGIRVGLVDLEGRLQERVSRRGGLIEPDGQGPWIVRIDDPEFVPYFRVIGGDAGKVIVLVRGATIEAHVDDGGYGLPQETTLVLLPSNMGNPMPQSAWRPRLSQLSAKGGSLKERVASLFEPSRTEEERVETLRLDGHEGGLMTLLQSLAKGGLLEEVFSFDAALLRHDLAPNNTVTWSRVPPGAGWRWGLDAALRATFKPFPTEPWDQAGPKTEDCSGPFNLEEGQILTVGATLLPSGAIGGRIPPRLIDDWDALIEASIKGLTNGPDNRPAEGWLKVAEVTPNDQGEFLFPTLEPGEYQLKATWKESADLLAIDMTRCELRPFETRDVGLLSAQSGITETFELRLINEVGSPLLPESVLLAPDDFGVWLYLGPDLREGAPFAADRLFSQRFPVELNTPLRVKGLPPGPYSFRWDYKGNAGTLKPTEGTTWELRPGRQFVHASLLGGTTVIPITAESKNPVQVEFPSLGDFEPTSIDCFIFSPDEPPVSDYIDRSIVESDDGSRRFVLSPHIFNLAPGPKRMVGTIVQRNPADGVPPRTKCFDVSFEVPRQGPLTIPDLQDTASVTGDLGRWGQSDEPLVAAPAPEGYVPLMGGDTSLTTRNGDTSFRIDGLIPNMNYVLTNFDDESLNTPFTTGGPGTTVKLP